MNKKTFFAFALLAALAVFPAGIHAQTTSQLTVHPALVEEAVNPGDTFSSSILVTNPDPFSKSLQLRVRDISDIKNDGTPVFSEGSSTSPYGMSTWVHVNTSAFTLKGGESKEVSFTITIPKDASPGGHYGGIFFANAGGQLNGNGSAVGYEVGTLIDLRIAGNAEESAAITEFSTDGFLYQSPNVTFTTRVANKGDVLINPRGPIDITNMFGKKVGTIVMNDANGGVFPGSERTFTVSWNGKGFSLGRYEATMSLGYGDVGQKTVSAATVFWVLPVVPILAVLIGVIALILIFIFGLKWYIRRKLAALGAPQGGEGNPRVNEEFLYQSKLPFSRLLLITIIAIIFTILFLVVLFIVFG